MDLFSVRAMASTPVAASDRAAATPDCSPAPGSTEEMFWRLEEENRAFRDIRNKIVDSGCRLGEPERAELEAAIAKIARMIADAETAATVVHVPPNLVAGSAPPFLLFQLTG